MAVQATREAEEETANANKLLAASDLELGELRSRVSQLEAELLTANHASELKDEAEFPCNEVDERVLQLEAEIVLLKSERGTAQEVLKYGIYRTDSCLCS